MEITIFFKNKCLRMSEHLSHRFEQRKKGWKSFFLCEISRSSENDDSERPVLWNANLILRDQYISLYYFGLENL